jgi:hypothetical protein
MSGDRIALSTASPGEFSVLNDDPGTVEFDYIAGTWTNPQGSTPGQYRLNQPDPSQPIPNPTLTIDTIVGTWTPRTTVLTSGTSNFEFVTFPQSSDSNVQACVAYVRNGTSITNMYVGEVNLLNGTLTIIPVGDLNPATTANSIVGTVSNFVDATGTTVSNPNTQSAYASIRRGSFTLSGTLPTGFSSSGTFVVFRK